MASPSDMKLLAVIAAIAIAGATAYLLLEGNTESPAAPIVVTLPSVTAPTTATTQARSAAGGIDSPRAQRAAPRLPRVRLDPPPDSVRGPAFPSATVRPGQRVALHISPAGRVFEQVGDRTEFGSVRVYWIEKLKRGWFGVPTPDLPNGKLAWIKDDRFKLSISQTHFWVSADLSAHRLALHYARRLVERFPVTVGSQTSPTPIGACSVTDGPPGWIGGDRIAVHGTPGSVGGDDS